MGNKIADALYKMSLSAIILAINVKVSAIVVVEGTIGVGFIIKGKDKGAHPIVSGDVGGETDLDFLGNLSIGAVYPEDINKFNSDKLTGESEKTTFEVSPRKFTSVGVSKSTAHDANEGNVNTYSVSGPAGISVKDAFSGI